MSLRGRYIIDRIKSVVSNHFRLPCPPYGDPGYWDAAYMSLGPQDSYEWGDVTLNNLVTYKYRPVKWDVQSSSSTTSTTMQQSSLGESLGVSPNADKDEPMLMLGCGNSTLGEEMVEYGWRGPLIQVDVSSRVIETMSHRCHQLIQNGHMNFVQDDACELSAFRDDMMHACLDKGLIDAIYCAEEYDQLGEILKSVGRVLRPGGSFVFLSFSRPEFLLPRLMKEEIQDIVRRRQWTNLQVQELEKILLYKLQKVDTNQHEEFRYRPNRIRNDKFKR
jgi:ubiquinone/menaquinone biosynthesis C-methylase UbiE